LNVWRKGEGHRVKGKEVRPGEFKRRGKMYTRGGIENGEKGGENRVLKGGGGKKDRGGGS